MGFQKIPGFSGMQWDRVGWGTGEVFVDVNGHYILACISM
jgi:hypothetical protein